MQFVNIVPLGTFREAAERANLSLRARRRIAATIRTNPSMGDLVTPLFDEPGKLPMGGFYSRTWKLRVGNDWLEGHTLHLYLSKIFPVYLWSFAIGEDVDWRAKEAAAFLAEAGRDVYAELTTSETAE